VTKTSPFQGHHLVFLMEKMWTENKASNSILRAPVDS
jgi:hypothetical protein